MQLINADCIQAMKEMAENSVDAIVTDPPYELGFMGKKWDSSGIAFNVEVWQEALRVLKPGGHLLAFSGSRTYHRMVVAIEDAGFEIRDQIMWIYGSGFPKSHDVSKAIDKAAGAEREIIDKKMGATPNTGLYEAGFGVNEGKYVAVTPPATDSAKQWQGWGTALKPAHEPIVVARKPFIGTVAENVLEHGVGGLNIDCSRIGIEGGIKKTNPQLKSKIGNVYGNGLNGGVKLPINAGRWPANIILDPYTAGLLDEQSGNLKSGAIKSGTKAQDLSTNSMGAWIDRTLTTEFQASEGGASRFFYCAKASKRDRNEGLDNLPEIQTTGGGGLTAELREDGSFETASAGGKYGSIKAKQTNFHPTVKPTSLMRYLVRLVTPPNGLVLDPFMGSGSTGKACALEHFDFVGIELNAEYMKICEARIENALQEKEHQQELF